jgi:hypothetical protein
MNGGKFGVNGAGVSVQPDAPCSVCGNTPAVYAYIQGGKVIAYQCAQCVACKSIEELLSRHALKTGKPAPSFYSDSMADDDAYREIDDDYYEEP